MPHVDLYPVSPGGDEKTPVVAATTRDLLPDRRLEPTLCPPLGLHPEPRRARVKGVTSTHHEEVGGLPVISPDFAFAILAIRGRYR